MLARPDKPAWFQEWGSVAIVACGHSASNANVEQLRGRIKTFAIKEAFTRLTPFADAVYCCEGAWWKHVRGLPDFRGLKVAWDGASMDFRDIERVRLKAKTEDRLLFDEPGMIGSGGNSGFQALNIALQFGATRVLLIGFDMSGAHFYGRNNWLKAMNPDESVFGRWRKAFDAAALECKRRGIDVVNTSPVSTITGFRKARIAETLEGWGL